MLYDTHCHPYLANEKSQEVILENFFSTGGNYLNTIACDLDSSQTCIDLAMKNSWVYATIWIHPTHVFDSELSLETIISQLEVLYQKNSEHIVAIWETWLDYHWLESLSNKYAIPQDQVVSIQKDFFRAQIQLAKKLNLPIIIHNRNSAEDVLEILIEQDCKNFVFHCYSEDYKYAQRLLQHAPNCMLWFWWIVTFKSALPIQDAATKIPIRNIIIETDSPYLTPTPYRGKEENEPLYTREVLSKIIDLRAEDSQTITQQIFKNSTRFFAI